MRGFTRDETNLERTVDFWRRVSASRMVAFGVELQFITGGDAGGALVAAACIPIGMTSCA